MCLKLRQAEKAAVCFGRAVQLKPMDPRLHYNLATAFARQGKFDEAVSEVRQVLRIQPTNADFHCVLGDLLLRQGKREEAIKAYREALQIQPEHPRARQNLEVALTNK